MGEPLGLEPVAAARAIRVLFDSAMADLLRSVTIERGHDPREFTLIAGGGSGPSHAWALCRELGLEGFVVPATATAQSAFGAGTSDLLTTASRTAYVRLGGGVQPTDEHAAVLAASLEETDAAALAAMPESESAEVERTVAVRYHGQAHHLDVPIVTAPGVQAVADALTAFEAQYEKLFGAGAGFREAGFELLSVRSVASRHTAVTGAAGADSADSADRGDQLEHLGNRPVVFDDPDNPDDTAVYACRRPAAGQHVAGPCLINLPGCVVVVPPRGEATTDSAGIIHVKVGSL